MNWHFDARTFNPASCSRRRTSSSVLRCSSSDLLLTRMSSRYTATDGMPLSIFSISRWKIPGPAEIPKGRRVYVMGPLASARGYLQRRRHGFSTWGGRVERSVMVSPTKKEKSPYFSHYFFSARQNKISKYFNLFLFLFRRPKVGANPRDFQKCGGHDPCEPPVATPLCGWNVHLVAIIFYASV